MLVFALVGATSVLRADAPWQDLLDASLSEWDMYLGFRHQPGYHGDAPVDAAGQALRPVGYGENEAGVFSVLDENGQPVLRISGEIYGCVFTKREFQNYRLRLKVKWGAQKWDPRKQLLRDSGILYHSVGEAGVDYWRSWMLSQEFQIMEGHMGDYWPIGSSAIDIRAFPPEGTMNSVASARQPFRAFGAGGIASFCMRDVDHESPDGEWTTLELVCFDGRSVHLVNGHVVMVLKNSRVVRDGVELPLTRGRIQLQSEAAEVFFKEIQLQELAALPDEFAELFEEAE